MNFFLKTSPYDLYKDSFNFFYIDPLDYEPECELYQDKAILCYSKEIIKKASSCPNDQIVVIKARSSSIRSSAYMNVLSINLNHNLNVLTHELGHSLANLADEYTKTTLPKGAENCKKQCDEFGEEKDGCYLGCSEEDYFRSIENGVMRTLSSNNYGIFNKKIISAKIDKETQSKITGSAVGEEIIDCSDKEYYLIGGTYDKNNENKITIIEASSQTGCVGSNGVGGFDYNLIKKDDSIVSTGEFNPELIFTDNEEGGETLYNKEQPFLLKIPAILNSKSLEIIENGEKISEVNLKYIDSAPCKK